MSAPKKSTAPAASRARKALAEGKRPTTAAGAFVEKELRHEKSGKHGLRSRAQAIAVGLSEARRAGIPVPPNPHASGKKQEKRAVSSRSGKKRPARAPRGGRGGRSR